MHLAVCDDNIADRKQTERLLGREADKWIAQGDTLYIESFGNVEALTKTPMVYDAFMIDVCHTVGVSSLQIVKALREKGVTAPMILMCSDVDYRNQDFEEGTRFIDKPFYAEALHELLCDVKYQLRKIVPNVELRGEDETFYIKESDILYAEEKGYFTHVTLTDGNVIKARCTANVLFQEIQRDHPDFVMPTYKSIINIQHITQIKFRTAYMDDGNKFGVHGTVLDYIKDRMELIGEK